MSIAQDLKAKIDELELERRLKELVDETEKTAGEAVQKAGGLAHDKRDDIVEALDKASAKVNEKTKGQYADKVETVRTTVLEALDKLASRRQLGDPVAPIEPPEESRPTDPPLS